MADVGVGPLSRRRSSPTSTPTTTPSNGRRLQTAAADANERSFARFIRRSSRSIAACSTSATATASIGSASAPRAPSRPCSCMAGRAARPRRSMRRVFDPEALRRDPVRPARLRQVDAACQPRRQHDLAPRRRHRAAARTGRLRQMAGVRRLVGLDAGAGLCRDASRARQRARPARHLHADQARARLVLSVRRVGDVPGQMGALPGADPRGRARRHDGRLPQAADRQRPQGADRMRPRLEPVGRRDHHAAARPRDHRASSARTISPSPSRASRTTISCMAAGWRRTS